MATQQPKPRLTLTRVQRDALHTILAEELPHVFGDESRDLDDVRDRRDLSRPFFELLDQIGWNAAGTSDHYDVAVDVDWLRGVIERRRNDAHLDIAYEQRALASARAGDSGWLVPGGTLADTERQVQRSVDEALDEVRRVDVVMAAIGAVADR